jgi:hypothetical protein
MADSDSQAPKITAFKSKAHLVREAAVQLGISFAEEEVPGQNDVVRFVFPPLDSAMTYRLASAVPLEAYAKRAFIGGVS